MPLPNEIIQWIDQVSPSAIAFTKQLAHINSWSYNPKGIRDCLEFIQKNAPIKGRSIQKTPHNTHDILIIKHHHSSNLKHLLFNIHCDTVYPPSTHFPISETTERLFGPGVADAKGGIAIVLWTLATLEKMEAPFNWTLIINSDEEIGSPFSKDVLKLEASRHDFGFIFEPSLPNGNIVSSRKGSYNGQLSSKGKSAHAGRSIQDGINAITPLCNAITQISTFLNKNTTLSYNLGTISGGTAINQVPDYAEAKFNIRSSDSKVITTALDTIHDILKQNSVTLSQISYRPPKPLNESLQTCIDIMSKAIQELGLSIQFEPSGGVCDGNDLHHYGLPTLDTLGPVGGGLHSTDEYVLKESFSERIKLATLYISKILQHN